MRIIFILFTFIFFASETSAQQNFTQKDFNKLKILSEDWLIQSSNNIYEEWEVLNDSTIKGLRYDIIDTIYVLGAEMTLSYSNREIKISYNFIEVNNIKGKDNILHLKSIKKNEYFFNNDAAEIISSEERKNNSEKICTRHFFNFQEKDKIKATNMHINPEKGLSTEIYLYVKK